MGRSSLVYADYLGFVKEWVIYYEVMTKKLKKNIKTWVAQNTTHVLTIIVS